jgi:hypothetical protein
MSPRACLVFALVLACTPDQPTTPPERWPDNLRVGPAEAIAAPATTTPTPPQDPPATATAVATPTQPAHAGDPLEALAPVRGKQGLPGPRSATGGCEGGQRGVGEAWKVDCNECSCGDDGQVTCTAMACGYR